MIHIKKSSDEYLNMHWILKSLFLSQLVCVVAVMAAPPSGATWDIIFNDNFDGTTFDATKWVATDFFCGDRNDEAQAYMPANTSISGGSLHLTAKKENVNYGYCGRPGDTKSYSSGIVITYNKFSFKFGYAEARIKIPKVVGSWPAFWMMPTSVNWPPEVDIMESFGNHTFANCGTWWGANYPNENGSQNKDEWIFPTIDYSAEYHVFACEWDTGSITYYLDGVEAFHSGAHSPIKSPMFLMLNLAMGGTGTQGVVPADNAFPFEMLVDWVRVYKKVSQDVDRITAHGEKGYSGCYTSTEDRFQLFDGKTGTKWIDAWDPGKPRWVQYQFGANRKPVVSSYKITSQGDYNPEYDPKDWVLKASNNGVTWTTIDTRSGITWNRSETKTFSFSNSTGYNNYRIEVTNPPNRVQIAEIQFVGASTSINQHSIPAFVEKSAGVRIVHFHDVLHISINEPGAFTVDIINAQGSQVARFTGRDNTELRMLYGQLQKGVCFARITSAQGTNVVRLLSL